MLYVYLVIPSTVYLSSSGTQVAVSQAVSVCVWSVCVVNDSLTLNSTMRGAGLISKHTQAQLPLQGDRCPTYLEQVCEGVGEEYECKYQ